MPVHVQGSDGAVAPARSRVPVAAYSLGAVDVDVVPLEDGSWLVITVGGAEGSGKAERHDGTFLGVTDFFTEAAAAGAIGNITYATLRAAAERLRARSTGSSGDPLEPAQVVGVVSDFLGETGYDEVVVTEFRAVGKQGFFVRGTADQHRFDARADPSGALVHLRVD